MKINYSISKHILVHLLLLFKTKKYIQSKSNEFFTKMSVILY